MKRKKTALAVLAALVSLCMMLTMLGGCTGHDTSDSHTTEASSDEGMKDGERFETVILLEGMEETVRYEHVRNETIGFEMDYDYETLERRSGQDYEQFLSRFDDPKKPENYLEVSCRPEDVRTVAAAIRADLQKTYGSVTTEEQYTLDRAGSCVQISAVQAKKDKAYQDSMQTVYIIPAANGCLVAAAHYTVESAEGFGARFDSIVNTISVLGGQP